jgi:hypothetical protein
MGGLGCCCCSCQELEEYLNADKVTIPGFTRVGGWSNVGSGYNGLCCFTGIFVADDCETNHICDVCGPHVCPFTNFVFDDCERTDYQLTQYCGRRIAIANGCVREVRIYRHWYDATKFGESCGPLEWCKFVVFVGYRDYLVWSQINQRSFFAEFDNFQDLTDCPFAACNGEPCYSDNTSACNGVIWGCYTNTFSYVWWRVREFESLPQGTICFDESHVTLEPCNSLLKCVDTSTLPFRSTSVCYPNSPGVLTVVCNPGSSLNFFNCSLCPGFSEFNCPQYDLLPPPCFLPPDPYCVEFAAP